LRSCSKKRAFTLGEILIAILFLTISVLAVIGIQTYAAQSQLKAGERFRASQKAEAVMADIEEVLRGDLEVDVSVARIVLPPEYNPEGHPDFEYEVISDFLGAPSDRLKAVTINLYWTDRQGEQSFSCESRFTE
jgi:sensor domain CHASE-containing protein